MKAAFVMSAALLVCSGAVAASFDCNKASSRLEKLICATPELNDADTAMGQAYAEALKAFPLQGYIKNTQRLWVLGEYSYCPNATQCTQAVRNRIEGLNSLRSALVYADYEGRRYRADGGTIIVTQHGADRVAVFSGNWMPDVSTDPNKMRGYPFDGVWCDEEVVLSQVGHAYVAKEPERNGTSEDFSIVIEPTKATVTGHIMCSPRTGFADGVYLRKQ